GLAAHPCQTRWPTAACALANPRISKLACLQAPASARGSFLSRQRRDSSSAPRKRRAMSRCFPLGGTRNIQRIYRKRDLDIGPETPLSNEPTGSRGFIGCSRGDNFPANDAAS